MTAREIYEVVTTEIVMSLSIEQSIATHKIMASAYPLGEKEYYKKVMFDITQELKDTKFFFEWANNKFGYIFGEDGKEPMNFTMMDEVAKLLLDDCKEDEVFGFIKGWYIEFIPQYLVYHRLSELTKEDDLSKYIRCGLESEYKKIESQLIQNGYIENGLWVGKFVELQELCALLLLCNYFRQDIQHKESNGNIDGTKIREFCKVRFGVDLKQHFQCKRLKEAIDRIRCNNRRLKNINIKPQ